MSIINNYGETTRMMTHDDQLIPKRVSNFEILGKLRHDNRMGIGLRPDGLPEIDWVRIPEGEFIYQHGEIVHLSQYYISRYLITYKQFQPFIDRSDGLKNEKWWNCPNYIQNSLTELDTRIGNLPRDMVSWYAAVAFCRWLSDKLCYEVCLPTEKEWEKAARGPDGCEYPYGNSYVITNGNTTETNIGHTTPVGIFTEGASPYGVLDMSGNVWEWCMNEYLVDDETWHVVRGGAWNDHKYRARCCSLKCVKSYGENNIGFRLVSANLPYSNIF